MTTTLGRNHALLRRLRALRRDPALRERERVFVAEGRNLVEEAASSGAEIELVVLSRAAFERPDGEAPRDAVPAFEERGVPVYLVADSVMRSLQDARTPQSILAVVRRPRATRPPALSSDALIVVACGIQDPGNLGTLMRTSEAAGADLFVATTAGADLYHPRTVRASAGSIFRLASVAWPTGELEARLAEHGVRWIGTSAGAGDDYHDVDLTGSLALFFGAEGPGLPDEVVSRLDASARIPMRPDVESLSVGAAAAVVLFEADRQRRRSVP